MQTRGLVLLSTCMHMANREIPSALRHLPSFGQHVTARASDGGNRCVSRETRGCSHAAGVTRAWLAEV